MVRTLLVPSFQPTVPIRGLPVLLHNQRLYITSPMHSHGRRHDAVISLNYLWNTSTSIMHFEAYSCRLCVMKTMIRCWDKGIYPILEYGAIEQVFFNFHHALYE
ncbi:hypothetical protein BDN70DRAFT_436367 [Pholiota conissans]|uniref:Uncharacterized protein n=1 Tax=Pholiota conissans TaxID=109636 RepID=A0A9P5Z8W8_9AGAR|nr:hypothetical protein BDN70DRAFT_436367 [Pholiota conissans]